MFLACSDWPLKLEIAFLPTSDQGRESARGSFQLSPVSVIYLAVIFISTSGSNYQIALNYLATATLTSQSLFRTPFTLTPLPQGQPPLSITGTDFPLFCSLSSCGSFSGGFYSDSVANVEDSCFLCNKGTYVSPEKAPGTDVLECTVCPTGKMSINDLSKQGYHRNTSTESQ